MLLTLNQRVIIFLSSWTKRQWCLRRDKAAGVGGGGAGRAETSPTISHSGKTHFKHGKIFCIEILIFLKTFCCQLNNFPVL